MKVRVFAAVSVVALSVASIAAAAADPQPTPEPVATPLGAAGVKITGCSLTYAERSHMADKLHVDFVNLNVLPVTHIRFRVQANLSTFAVMDVGRFDPNVHIHHDLDPPELPILPAIPELGVTGLNCSVDAYTLLNGSTWISEALQLELRPRPPQR